MNDRWFNALSGTVGLLISLAIVAFFVGMSLAPKPAIQEVHVKFDGPIVVILRHE
jgi:hypothetical protein